MIQPFTSARTAGARSPHDPFSYPFTPTGSPLPGSGSVNREPKLSRNTLNICGGEIRHSAAGCVMFLVLTEKNSEADVDSYRSVQRLCKWYDGGLRRADQ